MPPLPWRTYQAAESETTYVVTITRLPLRSHLRIPKIMLATIRMMRELRRSEGLIGYALKADLIGKTFWTMSAWRDEPTLTHFVRSDTHRSAMAALRPHIADTRIHTFTLPGSELPPAWSDVATRLTAATATHPETGVKTAPML